jgi:hypothetical protein
MDLVRCEECTPIHTFQLGDFIGCRSVIYLADGLYADSVAGF